MMTAWYRRWLVTAMTAALLTQFGCKEPQAPVTPFMVSPIIAATAPFGTVELAAGTTQPVLWRVNGIAGGNDQVGTVWTNGLYTAPGQLPEGDSVLVEAVLAGDTAVRSAATVFFVPNLAAKDYYVALPRVVDATHPQPTRFLVVPNANVTTVASSVAGQASPIGSGVHTFVLGAGPALNGYATGTLHNPVGSLEYRDAGGAQVKLANLSVNVRDAGMPDVVVTSLAPDAQRSPHLLNLRVDDVTINPWSVVVARALQLAGGDLFDFVAVVATVTTNTNRNYGALRNDVQGIGVPLFDESPAWGGTGRLRGAIAYPIDGFLDGAEAGFMHEIGHSWINYAADDTILRGGIPHWPPSTMARGVMGFNIPGSRVGGHFQWSLQWLGAGTGRTIATPDTDSFAPLDLYLMGLLPPDSVPAMYLLSPSVDPRTLTSGGLVPAIEYTIDDYIAAQGPRNPASSASREFAVLVLVLTYGRLLTASEMAFFDYASARAETTVPLQSQSGFARVTASGFYLATGGRATLTTRLP